MPTLTNITWSHNGLDYISDVDYCLEEHQTREYPGVSAYVEDISSVKVRNPKTKEWLPIPDLLVAEEWFFSEVESSVFKGVTDYFTSLECYDDERD